MHSGRLTPNQLTHPTHPKGEEAGDTHRDRRAFVTLVVALLIVGYGILGK